MARRYTQDEKDHALGALMASAVLVEGEWVPNVVAVERQTGIHERTLGRWWAARDKSEDADLRGTVTRTREEARESGARDFLSTLLAQCKDSLLWATAAERREADYITDNQGRVVVLTPGTRADAMAKAAEIATRVGVQLDAMTSERGGREGDNRTASVLAMARRAGLIPSDDDSR